MASSLLCAANDKCRLLSNECNGAHACIYSDEPTHAICGRLVPDEKRKNFAPDSPEEGYGSRRICSAYHVSASNPPKSERFAMFSQQSEVSSILVTDSESELRSGTDSKASITKNELRNRLNTCRKELRMLFETWRAGYEARRGEFRTANAVFDTFTDFVTRDYRGQKKMLMRCKLCFRSPGATLPSSLFVYLKATRLKRFFHFMERQLPYEIMQYY